MTRTTVLKAALPLAFVLVGACTGVKKSVTPISPAFQASPTCPAAINTYASRAEVPSDYYEVAWVEAECNSVYTTDNQLQEQVKNAAAKAGASAVIVNPVEQAKTTVKILGEALGAKSATQKATALAIYLPADRDRVVQACGK